MEVMAGDDVETPIWDTYKEIIGKHDDRGEAVIGNIERFKFYDEAKQVYCIIATGETALYANVMLQKGVVVD
jgi:L-fucose mutarotase